MEQKLKFEFTVQDANKILTALASQQYSQVVDLISDIQKQAKASLDALEKSNIKDS